MLANGFSKKGLILCVVMVVGSVIPIFATANISVNTLLVLDGEAAGDWFGYGIALAGDVNGDGFKDFLVGAYFNDAGGTDAGRVYLYLGGPTVDAVPDLIFTGEQPSDYLSSVARAGDVNGDGFDDFLLGARGKYGTYPGRAYLHFGGPTLDATPDLTFEGENPGDIFGHTLAGVGDINADGYDDFIISAAWWPHKGYHGRSYIYFGGPGLDNIADMVINGPAGGEFGVGMAPGGDLNCDGHSDFVIGAYKSDLGGFDSGGAWLYYGGPGLDGAADLVFAGEGSINFFGGQIDLAGDVNGDSFEDLIIGAKNFPNQQGIGRAYLYLGGPLIDATADLVLTGETVGDVFGSVAGIGDVNHDGFSDFIVGANGNDSAAPDAGKSYIYFGGPGLDATPDIVLTGEAAGDNFGRRLSSVGDVNGDGYLEFAVTADQSDAAGTDAGRVYVYTTNPGFTPVGSDVDIIFEDPLTGDTIATVTFESVAVAGFTDLEITSTGPPPPSGFKLTKPKTYYYFTTTAVFSGTIEVCIDYSGMTVGDQTKLELEHFEAGHWTPCTSFHDKVDSVICCDNLSSLSPFAIFEPIPYTLDIKPRSCPNPFNIAWMNNLDEGNGNDHAKNKKGGVLPAAIAGSEDVDVNEIDLSTLRLEGIEPLRSGLEDVTRPVSDTDECACTTAGPDGFTDLTLKFSRLEVAEVLGDVEHGDVVKLTITGELTDGTPFEASDCIKILSKHPEPQTTTESDNVELGPAIPNPFNPSTTISYYLPLECEVTLEIYDSSGRFIACLMNRETQPKGSHSIEWRGLDEHGIPVSSGVYFYRLQAGKETISRKIVLLK